MDFKISIKDVVAIGIGAALFVVIGMISIPTPVPNTSIQLQYVVQALFALVFGPIPGFLVGFIGHALKDALQYGNPWWTWVIASGLFGLIVGLFRKYINVTEGIFGTRQILIFNGIQFVANFLIWAVIAPIGDILIYSEPANKVFAQGVVAATVNSATILVAGTLLLLAYAGRQTKSASLSKD
ncbi:ECF-type riboflavin transporter substrate-binding protein [Streptococcus sp. DD10]|uniref:ECF-type riboflavin transporter substrate-binding protein n=1 Tax=Streptococcus sp. DD10 TaxID=1777878 RepID=UPI00082BEA61|nr:ECF-type riboflavin transporter substrate-binding protein [Streptococcus sp. DD10]